MNRRSSIALPPFLLALCLILPGACSKASSDTSIHPPESDWTKAEANLASYLESANVAPSALEKHQIAGYDEWLPDVRFYGIKDHSSLDLIALTKDGRILPADDWQEGDQPFIVKALKDVRVLTKEDGLRAGRLCFAVMDLIDVGSMRKRSDIMRDWPMTAIGDNGGGKSVFCGGYWSKNPGFDLQLNSEGGIESARFWWFD